MSADDAGGSRNGSRMCGEAAMTAIVQDERVDIPEVACLEVGVAPGPRPGTVQVVVSGELDFDNAVFLREALLAALFSHRATLLVDLERVNFCDCAASTPS